MMKTAGFKLYTKSTIRKEPIEFMCYTLFDDTDIPLNTKDVEEPVENIIPKMQESINLWEGGLKATEGALNPTKRT